MAELALPSTIPMIVLQNCNLFPQGLLPLYIFEPRYRQMLRHTLEQDRMFCVGTVTPPFPGQPEMSEDDDRIDSASTAGMVRACVNHHDGTSHLVLLGLKRIRIVGWKQREPYRVALIEPLKPINHDTELALRLANRLRNCTLAYLKSTDSKPASQLHAHLETIEAPDAIADFLATHFIPEAYERQDILGIGDTEHRLELLRERVPIEGFVDS